MKLKKLLLLTCIAIMVLTGCGDTSDVDALRSMEALNSQSSSKKNYSLSMTDEQTIVYQQVADRTLLDLSMLNACSEDEIQQVVAYMNNVDAQLVGQIAKENGVIDSCFTDYLLTEFEKTPYYWQRTNTTIRGIDAESRSIIVDVNYKTIDFEKDVQNKSPLVLGEPLYNDKMKIRYDKWMAILNAKYGNSWGNTMDWQTELTKFTEAYGDPEEIYASQSNFTPTDLLFETGNQKTYTGLIDTEAETSHATMSVRYILVPNYVLGINLGMTCKHMYVTDFKLENDITSDAEIFKDEGYATVTDSVYQLVYSYLQCIDENDFSGLYKLTYDFGELDKYYEDLFNTTYMKHSNFTISLFDISGTHIKCGVTVGSKIRAKGSNMTFPSYTDRYYMEIELVDGVLQVQNMVLLSRKLEGEPSIDAGEADVSGFTAKIDLENADRMAIEKLICDFSALQLNGDVISDSFGDVVDISLSQSDMELLKENMLSHSGVHKVCWLQNYQQGTKDYASVKVKEQYQSASNSIVETECVYDFIRKGDSSKWYIFKYTVNSSVKLNTTNLNTTSSLCLVSPGKVEAYNSQVTGTVSTSTSNVSDISKSFDHAEYEPTLKTGTKEQGYDTEAAYNLPEDEYNMYLQDLLNTYMNGIDIVTYNSYVDIYESNRLIYDSTAPSVKDVMKNIIAIRYNSINSLYLPGEQNKVLTEFDRDYFDKFKSYSYGLQNIEGVSEEAIQNANDIVSFVNNCYREFN